MAGPVSRVLAAVSSSTVALPPSCGRCGVPSSSMSADRRAAGELEQRRDHRHRPTRPQQPRVRSARRHRRRPNRPPRARPGRAGRDRRPAALALPRPYPAAVLPDQQGDPRRRRLGELPRAQRRHHSLHRAAVRCASRVLPGPRGRTRRRRCAHHQRQRTSTTVVDVCTHEPPAQHDFAQFALRLWRLDRGATRNELTSLGITVTDWDGQSYLDARLGSSLTRVPR